MIAEVARACSLWVLLFLCGCTELDDKASSRRVPTGGAISLSPSRVARGRVPIETEIICEFELRNVSHGVINLSGLKKSCSCENVSVTLDGTTYVALTPGSIWQLMPNRMAKLRVIVTPRGGADALAIDCAQLKDAGHEVFGRHSWEATFDLDRVVARVPTRDPEDAGRWSVLLEKVQEVAVLRHHDGVRFGGGLEDLEVGRVSQAKFSQGYRFDVELLRDPRGESGRELSVDPEDHAPSTGWSNLRLAYVRQARMSSGSRSGSSSSTCSTESPFDSPFDSRSSTSMTRMRMPRTHARPPHCSGFTVIRSSRVVMRASSQEGA